MNCFERVFFITILLACCGSLAIGCSGRPARVSQPAYNPQAGAEAKAAYDINGDGAIAEEEFDSVGSLRAALRQLDSDGDKRLTAEEIDARVEQWKQTKIAEMPVHCEVTLDGNPLANAQITFEPESFLGGILQPASGTTGADGAASISLADEHLADPRYPGVPCGWYKIKVTAKGNILPARYNSDTILGCEVAIDAHWVNHGAVLLELKSS